MAVVVGWSGGQTLKLPSRFEMLRVLGRGSAGVVVAVRDCVLERPVALKLLAPHRLADPRFRSRFVREAKAAGALRHPNIVTVHEIDGNGEFIVMELIAGLSLDSILRNYGPLSADEMHRLAGDLLAGLAAAHRAGVVHRDVKPANILIDEYGTAKLADFGVASIASSDLTEIGTRIGTPAYMAPEQLRGHRVDPRADVFAAAATLFEAATNQRYRTRAGLFPDPGRALLEATGDQLLATAVVRALAEDPGQRFQDAGAFRAALANTPVPAPAPAGRRKRWPWLLAIAVAFASMAALAWLNQRGKAPDRLRSAVVAILPFEVLGSDPRLDFARTGLPHLLGTELGRDSKVALVGTYRLADRVGFDLSVDDPAWLDAAREFGAEVIVRGTLETTGADRARLVLRIARTSGQAIAEIERSVVLEDVPAATRELAPVIASRLFGSSEVETTARYEFAADRELQLGIAALERADLTAASRHLRAATASDPSLVEAQYHLALVRWWLSRPTAEVFEALDAALDSPSLTDDARTTLQLVRRIILLDYPDVLADVRALAAARPSDRNVLYALFEASFHGGFPAEAMDAYKRLLKVAPRDRLGLHHALQYYTARKMAGDSEWIASLLDDLSEPDRTLWRSRVHLARGQVDQAIAILEGASERGVASADERLSFELIAVRSMRGELNLAAELVDRLTERDPARAAIAQLAVATVRGDDKAADSWAVRARHAAALGVAGAGQRYPLLDLVAVAVVRGDRGELDALSDKLGRSAGSTPGKTIELDLGRALLAGATGNLSEIDSLAASHFPQVRAVAQALLAEQRSAYQDAVRHWQSAIDSDGTGRFRITLSYHLARAARLLGDTARVDAVCQELRTPALFHWAWAPAVRRCQEMRAD